MWIDSHAHLAALSSKERERELDLAREQSVQVIVNVATDLKSSRAVTQCTDPSRGLFAAAGISPFDVTTAGPHYKSILRELCARKGVIAVGETGMDLVHPAYPDIDRQQQVFETQCQIAVEASLPVIVHSRGAEQRAVDLLRAAGVERALFHCFTGSEKDLYYLLDNGYHVSFSGIITFKNTDMDALVRAVPGDRLQIETDSPYLAPHPLRGKPNHPAWVVHVARNVAWCRRTPEETLARELWQTFEVFFGCTLKKELF